MNIYTQYLSECVHAYVSIIGGFSGRMTECCWMTIWKLQNESCVLYIVADFCVLFIFKYQLSYVCDIFHLFVISLRCYLTKWSDITSKLNSVNSEICCIKTSIVFIKVNFSCQIGLCMQYMCARFQALIVFIFCSVFCVCVYVTEHC